MRILATLAGTAVLLLAPQAAVGAVYKCQRDGQTIISDKPCPKKAPVGDVDPTRPQAKNTEQPPLILDEPESSSARPAGAGDPGELSAAGDACLRYHRAMVSGNKTALKNLAVASRAADIDRIPASSFSAMVKVMPAAAAVERIDGDPNSGRALVRMRGTTGNNTKGYCTATLERGRWKILRQDWN